MEDNKPAFVSMGPADPGDAPSDSSSPVAVSLAEVERQLKQTQREAKHARLRGELRKSKPQGATAYHWTYFQTYVPVSLQMYSICKLCWEQGELDRAEVKYNQSPTNLLRHLNTAYPGHKEAYEACKDHKAGLKKAGGLSAAAAGGGGGGGASSIGSTSMGQPIWSYSLGSDLSPAWHQELVRWMVMNAIPFSMLEDTSFRKMVEAISSTARVPDANACIETMRGVKKSMMSKLSDMLKGEHVCITTDGWTSRDNDTYMSLTISLITSAWKLVTLSVECSQLEAAATGDALAGGVIAAVEKHSLKGRVTAITTSCGPAMTKMGRILEQGKVCAHVGCCNHRLERTASIVLNGSGIKSAIFLARRLVARYTTSSPMADRLAQFVKIYLGSEKTKVVIQDKATRWWSTTGMVRRLLELKRAIDKHEEEDALLPILMAVDWNILELILPVLEPFTRTQSWLEGRQQVSGSLVIPFMYDLRASLDEAIEEMGDLPASNDTNVNAARSAVIPCVAELRKDFTEQWGGGKDILTSYTESFGERQQPHGFQPVQVLATAIDPRTKILYGVEDDEHASVWEFVQKEAVKTALQNRRESITPSAGASSSSPQPPSSATAAAVASSRTPEGDSARKRRRGGGGFMEFSQSVGRSAAGQVGGDAADSSTTSVIINSVRLEVEAFQSTIGMRMFEPGKDEGDDEKGRVYLDPLDWWRRKSAEFPHLAGLARRVLALPSTQAESERLFSSAGNMVTGNMVSENRNDLSPEQVELLVLLRRSWGKVDKWEASNAAAAGSKRGSGQTR